MSFEHDLMVIRLHLMDICMPLQTIICPNFLLMAISLEWIAILKTCCPFKKIMFNIVIAYSCFLKKKFLCSKKVFAIYIYIL